MYVRGAAVHRRVQDTVTCTKEWGGGGVLKGETGEEVKCQWLVPLTLLQQSVIHEATHSPPSPSMGGGGGGYCLPLQADLPPSAEFFWSPPGLLPHAGVPTL